MLDYWEVTAGSGTYGASGAAFDATANNKIDVADDGDYSTSLDVTLTEDSAFTAHFKPVHYILPNASAVVIPLDSEEYSALTLVGDTKLRIGGELPSAHVRGGDTPVFGFKFILPSTLSVPNGMSPTIYINLYKGDSPEEENLFFNRSFWGAFTATTGLYFYVSPTSIGSIETMDSFTAKVWISPGDEDAVTRTYSMPLDSSGNSYIISSAVESARDAATAALGYILDYCKAAPGYALVKTRVEELYADAIAALQNTTAVETIYTLKLDAIGAMTGLVSANAGGGGYIAVAAAVEKFASDGGYIAEPALLSVPSYYTAAELLDALLNAAYPDGGAPEVGGDGWLFTVNNTVSQTAAGSVALADGDVVRWQYAKDSRGADATEAIANQADKDALTRKIAQIRASGTQPDYGGSYGAALTVLQNLGSTAEDVTTALEALVPAGSDAVHAAADDGGAVEPAASQDGNYTVTADAGLVIDGIWVDGAPLTDVQGLPEYTTATPPQRSIFATFVYAMAYDGAAPENGAFTVERDGEPLPSGSIVRGGETLTVSVTPVEGYELDEITAVSGLARQTQYRFTVTADAAPVITVTFKELSNAPKEPVDYAPALAEALARITTDVTDPQVGSMSGEWAVVALARAGVADSEWIEQYLSNVQAYIGSSAYSVGAAENGVRKVILNKSKYTDNSRVIVGLTSVGQSAASFPSDVEVEGVDYDLVSALTDKTQTVWQGLNGPIWALIALDSNGYLPDSGNLRAHYLQYILDHEKSNGGWDLNGETTGVPDADITGMALQALAPYYKMTADAYATSFPNAPAHTRIVSAVTKAVSALKAEFDGDGGFIGYGSSSVSSEGAAQVLVALCSLGYDGTQDGGFITDVLEHLLRYQNDDGGFRHLLYGVTGNAQMSTEQAAYALVAYDRYVHHENTLYDMRDVFTQSSDAGVQSVTVSYGIGGANSVTATAGEGNTFAAEIPFGVALPTESGAITVTPSSRKASVTTAPATTNGGATWTFTVTAEDGTPATYTLAVTNAPNPNASNADDVAAAKAAIESVEAASWTTALNVSDDIKAWLQGEVDALGLTATYGVTAEVTVTAFSAAVQGTPESKAGTAGSFTASVALSKGADATLAQGTAALNGVITATPYVSSDAGITGVTVNGKAGVIDGTSITVVLDYAEEAALPTEPGAVIITPRDANATVGTPETADGGATWTFTVTAEDGVTAVAYTVGVSIAENPAAGNISDVAAAKSAIELHNWNAAAETEITQALIEGVLAGLTLNDVTATLQVESIYVIPAIPGTAADSAGTSGSFTATVELSKGETETLATDTANITGSIAAIPYVFSTDANMTAITVADVPATVTDGTDGLNYTVTVPHDASLTAESFTVTLSDPKATVGTAETANSGAAWTITVTAEDGTTTRTYTVAVTVAEAPNAANAKLISDAKTYLEDEVVFEVSMLTANTEEAVRTWITDRLSKLPLAGVSAAVSNITVTPAIAGTEAAYDGTPGSFTASLALSKGDGEALAEIEAEISGAITASKYNPPSSGGVSGGDSITVTFRLIGASLSEDDIDMKISIDNSEADLWQGSEYQTWIATRGYTMREGDTNYDLFTRALADAGLQAVGAEKNYVETIYAPTYYGGHELSEFTNGRYSGWMYTVNGRHPGYGLKEYPLSDGDVVVWHYINDYRYEVQDWFDDKDYPALGDGNQWNKWLEAPDTNPPRDGSTAPGVGNTTDGDETDETDIDPNATPPSGGSNSGGGWQPDVVSQQAIETAPATTDDTGKATATVETAKVTEAVAEAVKAVEAAKAEGKTNAVAEIIIPVTVETTETGAAVKAVEAAIPAEAIKAIAEAKDVILTVESEVSTITLDAATLTAIADAAGTGETVTLTAAVVDNSEALNSKQQEKVGDNPVIELNISVGDTAITDLGGTVTVSVPYTPKDETAAEDYDLLTVYYLDDDGNIAEMTGASYDAATGKITFTTTHFSKFFIAEWISPFGDIAKGEWYYKAARYAYSNDLITGVTETTFAPQTSLTRAMLITILARNAGVDTAGGETWYSKAVEWGIANGITDGTNPNGEITREQFATMLYRYAVQELRIENGEWRIANGDVSGYSDAGQISDWAYDAMQWAVGTGLITGRTATTLAPSGTATRSEAAMLLQRYIESIG
ncbi:MAG: S-layer homology domain-containing protein [Oscillospiraceae bacterium]|nr:S-layer homology domain-containing protein [Oscillospiraceae bacterium]